MIEYPDELPFKTPVHEAWTRRLQGHASPFLHGGILDPRNRAFNIFNHCLSVSILTDVLVDALGSTAEISAETRETMVIAAFLHDAYKLEEMKQVDADPNDPTVLFKTVAEGDSWLEGLGVSERIRTFTRAFGNNAAIAINDRILATDEFRILHLTDDMIQGDEAVRFDERLTTAERNPRYRKQLRWSRPFFGGRTIYEAKRRFQEEFLAAKARSLGRGGHEPLQDGIIDSSLARIGSR